LVFVFTAMLSDQGIQVFQQLFQQCLSRLQLSEIMRWSWWNLQLLLLIGSQT